MSQLFPHPIPPPPPLAAALIALLHGWCPEGYLVRACYRRAGRLLLPLRFGKYGSHFVADLWLDDRRALLRASDIAGQVLFRCHLADPDSLPRLQALVTGLVAEHARQWACYHGPGP